MTFATEPRAAAGIETKTGPDRSLTPEVCTLKDMKNSADAQGLKVAISEGFQFLSPSDAADILRHCSYDRQRKIDSIHTQTLREMMQRGAWLEKSQLDFGHMPDGRLWLVNGHHRLTAQAGSGRGLVWAIAIHECDDVDALRGLYYRYDTNVRKRSAENILQGVDFAGQHGITKMMARALFNAAPIIASGMSVGNRHTTANALARRLTDDRLTIAAQFTGEAAAYETCIAPAPANVKRKLLLPTIAAVAFVTLRHEPDLATEFWHGLSLNDGLRRGDARATLLQDLTTRQGNSGSMGQFLVSAAKAWNAYYSGRLLKIIKVNTGHTVKIAGTPYEVET